MSKGQTAPKGAFKEKGKTQGGKTRGKAVKSAKNSKRVSDQAKKLCGTAKRMREDSPPVKQRNGDIEKDDQNKRGKDTSKMKNKKKKALTENEANRNEYDKALGRFKGQISRFRQEQALIMAYDADGWRGASKEKVKPHAELLRARESIAKCLEMIRDCIKICDEAGGDKSIPPECFDEDGELDADKIFCGKCLKQDSTDDNDIILCDGMCDRAYHMKCIFPPLDASILEDDSDEGWLCPACDRKIDMIDEINDELGTDYDYEEAWEKILAPGTLPDHEHYDLKTAAECQSAPTSWLDGIELPSEDESDEDFCATDPDDSDKGSESHSNDDSSSGLNNSESCVSEDINGHIEDVEVSGLNLETAKRQSKADLYKFLSETSPELVEGKRKRKKVDYKALNKELFGDIESPDLKAPIVGSSSDDDDDVWSPTKKRKGVC